MLWTRYVSVYLQALRLHGGELNVAKARDTLGRFTRYVDPVNLEDITQATYILYLARRKQDISRKTKLAISAATVNGDIRYLNAAFAAALQPLDENDKRLRLGLAAEGWRPPRSKRVRELERIPRTLSQDAFGLIFEAAKHAKRPLIPNGTPAQWWQTFFVVAYFTGLRCKELLMVKRPSALSLREEVLPLPAEIDKRGREHKLPIPPEVVVAIRNLPESPDGLLFSWPFDRTWFYRTLHQFQDKAGIPRGDHGLPHDLRRTKCTELIRAGHALPLIQREMRHSTLDVVMRYTGVITDEQKTANENLPIPDVVRQKFKPTIEDGQLCFAFSEESA